MIVQGTTDTFKQELLSGTHDFTGDTFKMALYTSDASLSRSTTTYSATNEVSGTGYTAGGAALTGATITLSNGVAYVDFDDVTWAASSITARGALIYNSSKSDRAVMVLDFGSDRTSNPDFTVKLPAATAAAALIRLA